MKKADKVIFALNSAAVGDLMASAPSLKWMIDTYFQDQEYKVAMYSDFREIFPFVPDEKIIPLSKEYPKEYAVRKINLDNIGGNNCRLTPSSISLVYYASIGLASRVLSPNVLKYIPLNEVDISHYEMDFKNAVVIVTSYRDPQRTILGSEISKIAKTVSDRGFTPVFVGKTGAISIWTNKANSDFKFEGIGVDLRNKTSLSEMYTIMAKSKVVIAVDGGPLHVALATDTTVIAGFTTVAPDIRIPVRNKGVLTLAVSPSENCRFCQSDWNLDFWNFKKCPRGLETPECVIDMTAEKFIKAFDSLNIKPE